MYTMLMVSTVNMISTISTQPASNFLLTDHTRPGLSALLPPSATHTVHYHLLEYPGALHISMPLLISIGLFDLQNKNI